MARGGRGRGKWLQAARARMEEKGSVGSFGKATQKKISSGMKAGGLQAKKANFARMAKRGFRPLGRSGRR